MKSRRSPAAAASEVGAAGLRVASVALDALAPPLPVKLAPPRRGRYHHRRTANTAGLRATPSTPPPPLRRRRTALAGLRAAPSTPIPCR